MEYFREINLTVRADGIVTPNVIYLGGQYEEYCTLLNFDFSQVLNNDIHFYAATITIEDDNKSISGSGQICEQIGTISPNNTQASYLFESFIADPEHAELAPHPSTNLRITVTLRNSENTLVFSSKTIRGFIVYTKSHHAYSPIATNWDSIVPRGVVKQDLFIDSMGILKSNRLPINKLMLDTDKSVWAITFPGEFEKFDTLSCFIKGIDYTYRIDHHIYDLGHSGADLVLYLFSAWVNQGGEVELQFAASKTQEGGLRPRVWYGAVNTINLGVGHVGWTSVDIDVDTSNWLHLSDSDQFDTVFITSDNKPFIPLTSESSENSSEQEIE